LKDASKKGDLENEESKMAYVEHSSLENQEEEIKESHNSPKRDDVTANGDEETSEQ
jgi:hypothetical protein